MTHYLLKWNPKEFSNEDFLRHFESYERREPLRWSCGTTKKIGPGDRFFLLKSGSEGSGIIGAGQIACHPYRDVHFNAEHAKASKAALYVDLQYDYLLRPGAAIPIHRHELDSPDLASPVWNVQGSGKTIPTEVADALERLWAQRVEVADFKSADEFGEVGAILCEGAVKTVYVNAYERNAEARRKCIDRWGHNCVVCSFRFDMNYGPIGTGFIHVHHLRPISSIREEYRVDPVEDLRPVCPNCHAMLHRKSPPISIEELQEIVALYRQRLR